MFVKYGFERQSPLAQQLMVPWGGAVARVARGRHADDPPRRVVDHATRSPCGRTRPTRTRTSSGPRSFRRDIARYANGGVYLNFIGDEGEDRVRAAYGDEKYQRLAAIKGEWDPDNIFKGNQNIKPAVEKELRPGNGHTKSAFTSRNSSKPYGPFSRPRPDCL